MLLIQVLYLACNFLSRFNRPRSLCQKSTGDMVLEDWVDEISDYPYPELMNVFSSFHVNLAG